MSLWKTIVSSFCIMTIIQWSVEFIMRKGFLIPQGVLLYHIPNKKLQIWPHNTFVPLWILIFTVFYLNKESKQMFIMRGWRWTSSFEFLDGCEQLLSNASIFFSSWSLPCKALGRKYLFSLTHHPFSVLMSSYTSELETLFSFSVKIT